MLAKIIYAGSNNTSYQQAHDDLGHLAELDVSAKQVRRLCKRIGDERVQERDAAVSAYQALPLVARKSAPAAAPCGRTKICTRPPSTPTTASAGGVRPAGADFRATSGNAW